MEPAGLHIFCLIMYIVGSVVAVGKNAGKGERPVL